tara:strand:- start:105673 stop:106353 length:681 start_codon:yes stop_codon:yes gene_type:complete
MADSLLERIIIEPKQIADSSVIWLHGLGASGDDFSDIIPMLGLSNTHRIRFIFPHAPHQAVTINGGAHMPAWYDISHVELDKRQDAVGILQSESWLIDLIVHEQEQGIPANKIIIMGFSQGGAVAGHTALRYTESLAGLGILSSYLPLPGLLKEQKHVANAAIPIFIAHGTMDPVVPISAAHQSQALLTELGYQPIIKSYPMAHAVCAQECLDLGQWIQNSLIGAE